MISMLIKECYPLTGKPYPKRLIFKVVGYSSSTWYENPTPRTGKRGRKSKHTVRKTFGSVDKDICKGMKLQLRSDHGSQYDSADFMNEMKFLGLEMSKAFIRSPQCNGIIERFHRTLEEQVLQVETFSSFEEAYNSINQFINDYNTDWIFHRRDHCSPVEYREKYAKSQRKEKD